MVTAKLRGLETTRVEMIGLELKDKKTKTVSAARKKLCAEIESRGWDVSAYELQVLNVYNPIERRRVLRLEAIPSGVKFNHGSF
jgi:hypothetical protein